MATHARPKDIAEGADARRDPPRAEWNVLGAGQASGHDGVRRRGRARSSPTVETRSKAQQPVDKLPTRLRRKQAQSVPAPREPKPEATERDGQGRFGKGHAKLGGRQPGSSNTIPKDAKTVMKLLAAGMIEIDGKNAAHVFSEQLVRGMEDPDARVALGYLLAFAKYGIGDPDKLGDAGTGRGMRIEFHKQAYDPLADPNDPPKPLRMLGQIWGPDGKTIVDARTGKPVALPSDGGGEREKPLEEDDGLGEGDDALEVVDDPMPLEDPHGV